MPRAVATAVRRKIDVRCLNKVLEAAEDEDEADMSAVARAGARAIVSWQHGM